jgi:hypothetical protein
VSCVKKKYSGKKLLLIGNFFMFFHMTQKNLVFHENWHAHIKRWHVYANFLFNSLKHLECLFEWRNHIQLDQKYISYKPNTSIIFGEQHFLQWLRFVGSVQVKPLDHRAEFIAPAPSKTHLIPYALHERYTAVFAFSSLVFE